MLKIFSLSLFISLSFSFDLKAKKKAGLKTYTEEGFKRSFDGSLGLIKMSATYREQIKKDLKVHIMTVSSTAIVKKNAIIGFMLEAIDKNSIFEKAGFEDGDIVTAIKGRALTGASSAIKILNSLRNADSIRLEFLRKGKPHELLVKVL